MAYGNIYWAGWHSLDGLSGYLYIDKKDYVLTTSKLVLKDQSIEIIYGFQDWNDPIIGMTAAFSIINDRSDFYELLPLLTAEERMYKIRITVIAPSAYTLFEGFLNCDTIKQTMLHRQEIRFAASSYLSKLEYLNPSSIEVLENLYFINVINEILAQTGLINNIRVNCSLYSRYGTNPTNTVTLFNRHTFFPELYWEDNIKRKTSLEVLRSILNAFDCYLYWHDEYWYIERYEDIWTSAGNLIQNYVEYVSGQKYGNYTEGEFLGAGTAVSVQKTLTNLHSLVFTEGSQVISTIPGYKTIEIQLQDKKYLNLLMSDLTNAADVSGDIPYPNVRAWQCWKDAFSSFYYRGAPFYNINNSITGNNITLVEAQKYRGLYTRFNITKNSGGNSTVLNITFTSIVWFGGWLPFKDKIKVTYHWYLRNTPGNNYIVYNSTTKVWEQIIANEYTGIQTIEKNGVDFDIIGGDKSSISISFEIPIGTISAISDGDLSLVLGIGLVKLEREAPFSPSFIWGVMGDFIAQVTETEMNNVISGALNANFLNKKEIPIDLFDIVNLNYKNGIYFGAGRTVDWTTDGVVYSSLIDRLLKNKFQLFNAFRQQISGNIRYYGPLKPLQMFYDAKQANKSFLLMGYTYNLTRDEYSIDLFEYDNTTPITLI